MGVGVERNDVRALGLQKNVIESQSVADAHGEKVLALFFVRVWERDGLENPQDRALWVERSL
jgi:hypothetical protein